jgi:hypothetical protein
LVKTPSAGAEDERLVVLTSSLHCSFSPVAQCVAPQARVTQAAPRSNQRPRLFFSRCVWQEDGGDIVFKGFDTDSGTVTLKMMVSGSGRVRHTDEPSGAQPWHVHDHSNNTHARSIKAPGLHPQLGVLGILQEQRLSNLARSPLV